MNGKREKMPPRKGQNRFYYPVNGRPCGLAGTGMQNVDPCSFADGLLESDLDPNGSYTGNPRDGGRPTQDADDL